MVIHLHTHACNQAVISLFAFYILKSEDLSRSSSTYTCISSILLLSLAFSNLKPGNPGGKLLSLSASACHIGETGAKLIDLVPLSSLYLCFLVFPFVICVFLRFVYLLYLCKSLC